MLKGSMAMFCIVLALALSVKAQNTELSEISAGQKLEREITTTEKHSYRFTLAANQFAYFKVQQNGIDVALKLIAPDGQTIGEFDAPNGRTGLEDVKAAFEKAGDYILEITVVERTKITGKYEINFSEKRDATPKDFKVFQSVIAYNDGIKLRGQRTIPALKQAVQKFEEAARLQGEVSDKKEQGIATTEKGLTQQMMGEYENAIATYKSAIPFYDEVKDYKNKGTTLNNIAFIKSRQSEYQEALLYLHQALETFKLTQNESNTVLPLINLANVYKIIGDNQRALQFYNEALPITKRNEMKNSETAISMNLGLIYSDLGEHQKGLDLHLQILPYYKSIRDNGGELNTLGYIADEYFYLGNYNESLNYFTQQQKQSEAASVKNNLLYAYFGMGKNYTVLNDSAKALENLQKAQSFSGDDKNSLAQILLWIGINKRNLGQLNEAKTDLEKAIDIVESIRNRLSSQELRTAYFSKTNRRIYEVYVSILMELFKQTKNSEFQARAFEYAEKSKARTLLELLALSRVDIRQGVEKTLLDEEKKLAKDLQDKGAQLSRLSAAKAAEDKLKEAQTNYSKAEEIFQQVEAKIRIASPHYAAITQLQTATLTETQNLLDSDTILLEFFLSENKSYLWLIGKNSLQSFELPKGKEIETKSRQFYELLTARNQRVKFETAEEKRIRIAKADSEFITISNELSQMLLSPAKNEIGNKKLLIVSEGALQYLPFAALKINNRYLIETNEILNLPSASTLSVLRRDSQNKKAAPKTLAVLADPVFDVRDERFTFAKTKLNVNPVATRSMEIEDLNRSVGDVEDGVLDIPRLTFTRKEAESISKLVPEDQRKVALDFAATRQLALSPEMNDFRILHFATHGLLNNRNPELSGLVFSLVDENGKPQNGFLRTDEVFNLKLSADLVVLSGCKTGLGKEVRGEGLVGLTRGFMYAGASRVMVSLWDVNDEATAELMAHFYQNLLGKKMKPSQALRETQLAFLKNKRFANPYYAMAFTLQGE
ncbi:MAG: CHAT domain-containing protein [Pyrinomonadaceae bacterium]|nr:CHAT domain-containing protein [Pyrinomonadaceae bacterium]